MLLLVFHAILFALILAAVVVPMLFIVRPEDVHAAPPSVGEADTSSLSGSVRQRLYILFVIPAGTTLHGIVLYFTVHRSIRQVQYRAEAVWLQLFWRCQQADLLEAAAHSAVVAASQADHTVGGDDVGVDSSAAPLRRSRTSFARFTVDQSHLTQRAEDLRQRARPDSVRADVYAGSALFPELKRLREAVEATVFEPVSHTEAKYMAAMDEHYGPMTVAAHNQSRTLQRGGWQQQQQQRRAASAPPLLIPASNHAGATIVVARDDPTPL